MSARALIRGIDNLGATEALPGLSELTGNVHTIAEEANRVGVQKLKCKNLAKRCQDLLLTFQSQERLLEGTPLQAVADEAELLLEKILKKFTEWRDLSKLQRYLRRDEIGQGIEYLNDEMTAVFQKFMINAAVKLYHTSSEMHQIQRQDREETRDMILDIVKNELWEVKKLANDGDIRDVENLMSGMQLTLQNEQTSKPDFEEIGHGLVQIVRETNVLPPIKDLRNEVILSSTQPVTGGVYSDIFLGTWHGEKVAVKGLRHVKATGPAIKMFEREVTIWSRVRHDNILALYGLTSLPGRAIEKQLFMVSPWQERGDILTFCKASPNSDRLALLEGAASAFSYLHQQQIVHGNVRCTNILVSAEGKPLICHFGLSKVVEGATETHAQTTLTSQPGSARYLAPELIKGEVTSPRMSSDVYSFAMAILECMTLDKPFSHRRRDATVVRDVVITRARPVRPTTGEGCTMPEQLWRLMESMWEEQAELRPSMQTVHTTLNQLRSPPALPNKVWL